MSRETILDALLSATAANENMMWMLAAIRMAKRPRLLPFPGEGLFFLSDKK
ncbi:hypothetical protein D3C75_347490 [compost metagenome]